MITSKAPGRSSPSIGKIRSIGHNAANVMHPCVGRDERMALQGSSASYIRVAWEVEILAGTVNPDYDNGMHTTAFRYDQQATHSRTVLGLYGNEFFVSASTGRLNVPNVARLSVCLYYDYRRCSHVSVEL